jgi:HAD superfamily hydrolase (TIGR01484 family)
MNIDKILPMFYNYMMPRFELLVSDIDGTLVPQGGDSLFDSRPTVAAFDEARQQGRHITLATGRPVQWLRHIIDEYGIVTPVIVNNGARIADPSNGETLWEQRLGEGVAETLKEFFGERALSKTAQLGLDTGIQTPFRTTALGAMEDSVYFDLIGLDSFEETMAIVEFTNGLDGTHSMAVASPQLPGGYNILVTHEHGTKYHGLRALQSMLGVGHEQTIAAGNDVNDIPLLEAAGLGAAVIDAHPKLAVVADVFIPDVYSYGVASMVRTYMLEQ